MSANPAAPAATEVTVSRAAAAIPALHGVYQVVEHDFRAMNEQIPQQLLSEVAMVEDIGTYIVESGGKRLRPLLTLLAAHSAGYTGQLHIPLAIVIEFLHTATLLHDDVVDRSDRRRGKSTVNAIWGNAPSVLVGDFLYSRAFQLMVEIGDSGVLKILADATNTIAEGEVLQLANLGNLKVSEAQYMETIRCKTALLFEAATHTAAVLASNCAYTQSALKEFGEQFGLAYQLIDDCLDYSGDSETMGKNTGDDFAEGKLTLPVIHCLAHGEENAAAELRRAISAPDLNHFGRVKEILQDSGSLRYAESAARKHGAAALSALRVLPETPARAAMETLTEYSLSRLS